MAIDSSAIEQSYQRKQHLRSEGIAGARNIASIAGQGVASAERARDQGMLNIRAQAARGLAQAAGQAGGMPMGGGLAAMMGQTARDRGLAQAEFGAGMESRIQDARLGAAQAQLAATKFEREAGSLGEDQQRRFLEIDQDVNDLQKQHAGFFDNDEGAVIRALYDKMAAEPDHVVKAYIARKISEMRNHWA